MEVVSSPASSIGWPGGLPCGMWRMVQDSNLRDTDARLFSKQVP